MKRKAGEEGQECGKEEAWIGCDFNRVGRVLTEKVIFDKKLQGSKNANHMHSSWKNILGRRESQANAPQQELPQVFEEQHRGQ